MTWPLVRTRHHEGLFFRCEALALAAPAEVFSRAADISSSPGASEVG
jgi:hypothetical protein